MDAATHHETAKPAEETLQQHQLDANKHGAPHDVEQSAEASSQHAKCDDTNEGVGDDLEPAVVECVQDVESHGPSDGVLNGLELFTEASAQHARSSDASNAAHHDAEQSVEGPTQQTPKTGVDDSRYNSGQDETRAWEKILEMRAREYQDDLAAMKDLHDDEMRYLRDDLSSETRRKELLQKRVKKEVLARKDLQQQVDSLQVEHSAAVEASAFKDREIDENVRSALAFRGRVKEMEKDFLNQKKTHMEAAMSYEEENKGKRAEVIALHGRVQELEKELRDRDLALDAQKPQAGESTTTGIPWEAWYHRACENGRRWRNERDKRTSEKEQAMAFAEDFNSELTTVKAANNRLTRELDAKQKQMESDGRYHEQIRGQHFDLQKRVNESIVDMARLKHKKAKAEHEAATEVKHLTRKLDNKTAEMSALEATRAEWQADPEGVLLTPSKGVDSDALIAALAKRFELTLNENDSLRQRMVVQEQEYDTLNGQVLDANGQLDGLSQSLAEKAREVTGLNDRIHDLETEILRRDMNGDADKRAEPGYLLAMEEVTRLQGQLKNRALEYATSMASLAADGPRKAIQDLKTLCDRLTADYKGLQQTLDEERRECYLDKAVVGAHIHALHAQLANAGAHKQRVIDAEKVWDRVRELEQREELDRIARLKSDAMTLVIRDQLEDQVAERESQIDELLKEVRRLRNAASEKDDEMF